MLSSGLGSACSTSAPAAIARHRKAIAMLITREARSARRAAPLTIFATHQPITASVNTIPSAKTRPSSVAHTQPAMVAPVSENTSPGLMGSNDNDKADPIVAGNIGWQL